MPNCDCTNFDESDRLPTNCSKNLSKAVPAQCFIILWYLYRTCSLGLLLLQKHISNFTTKFWLPKLLKAFLVRSGYVIKKFYLELLKRKKEKWLSVIHPLVFHFCSSRFRLGKNRAYAVDSTFRVWEWSNDSGLRLDYHE